MTGFLGSSNTLLNNPPITAPARPPKSGDTGSGKLFEIEAPMVAKEAEAVRLDESEPLLTC